MFRRVLARWLTVEGFEFWGAVSTRAMNSSIDHVIVMLSPTETLRNTRLGLSVDGKEHQRPWHDHSHGERAGKLKLPAVHRMGAAQVAPSFDPAHLHAFGTCVSLLYWTSFVVKRRTMHIFQQCEQGL
jgi:hypothetical protein